MQQPSSTRGPLGPRAGPLHTERLLHWERLLILLLAATIAKDGHQPGREVSQAGCRSDHLPRVLLHQSFAAVAETAMAELCFSGLHTQEGRCVRRSSSTSLASFEGHERYDLRALIS